MKKLVTDSPEKPLTRCEWNSATKQRLHFDKADVEVLEEGLTLFREGVAYFLEDEE